MLYIISFLLSLCFFHSIGMISLLSNLHTRGNFYCNWLHSLPLWPVVLGLPCSYLCYLLLFHFFLWKEICERVFYCFHYVWNSKNESNTWQYSVDSDIFLGVHILSNASLCPSWAFDLGYLAEPTSWIFLRVVLRSVYIMPWQPCFQSQWPFWPHLMNPIVVWHRVHTK